jgi:hypothetical protein
VAFGVRAHELRDQAIAPDVAHKPMREFAGMRQK